MFADANCSAQGVPHTATIVFVADELSSISESDRAKVNMVFNCLMMEFYSYNTHNPNKIYLNFELLRATDNMSFDSVVSMLNRNLGSQVVFGRGAADTQVPLICFVVSDVSVQRFESAVKLLENNPLYNKANKFIITLGEAAVCGFNNPLAGKVYGIVNLTEVQLLDDMIQRVFAAVDIDIKAAENIPPVASLPAQYNNCCQPSCSYSSVPSMPEKQKRGLRDMFKKKKQTPAPKNIEDTAKIPPLTEFVEQIPPSADSQQGDYAFCPRCGSHVSSDSMFCYHCGSSLLAAGSVPAKQKNNVNVSCVEFSAVAPAEFVRGEYSMVDITVYEEEYRHVAEQIIAQAEARVKETRGGVKEVEKNTVIRIRLTCQGLELAECEEEQTWVGKFLTYSFPVMIPEDFAQKQLLFVADVYFNDVIATKLKFVVNCTSGHPQEVPVQRQDVNSAFVSYASKDRSLVATIIQGMKKARPDMDVFFDVENLRSGEAWESVLYREIEKRDVLFLCWSANAKASKWVDTEWRYALETKGKEYIEPVPLVSPDECPPPEELSCMHFNDRALLYRK